ncbi:MAG: hypothetical protein PHQ90_00795 [Sulfuricurvum sp.]|uniref:hypothetical protein n=1 Tax=Sulfuricurvum sp. TaxID=2025608 RepID=UPI00260E779A|nr:hypothetical protein [Sulfuricurvum sp.]MDD2367803.1 hypothetical protein [Sulfuricurvum sp.]MDD5117982.1 hypothetical protein [Sulfuricurvum sp.]
MWLTKLKTALVLEEIDHISSLLDEMPTFSSLAEMEEASYLLSQTKTLIERNKVETAHTLQQLKSTIDFLNSTQINPPSSLNLKF